MDTIVKPTKGWTRLGTDSNAISPALICLYGAGGGGKSRFAAACNRAWPKQFGPRSVYVAIDPETQSLGPILLEDRPNMERVTLDVNKDVFAQMVDIYQYDWLKEGIRTIITDTMTVFSQFLHSQLTNSGRFSDRHIDLGSGIKQPMQGDYLATGTLIQALLHRQQASGLNHITLFHEQEVRPDAGAPGEPVGGPSTVGKASVRTTVNWYNTVLHAVRRPRKRTDLTKPVEYERVVYTDGHGIWQAKLRTHHPVNPAPEITMESDPANVWAKLRTIQEDNE
jgi:hypothetical protein